jgi:hypothetical protein
VSRRSKVGQEKDGLDTRPTLGVWQNSQWNWQICQFH